MWETLFSVYYARLQMDANALLFLLRDSVYVYSWVWATLSNLSNPQNAKYMTFWDLLRLDDKKPCSLRSSLLENNLLESWNLTCLQWPWGAMLWGNPRHQEKPQVGRLAGCFPGITGEVKYVTEAVLGRPEQTVCPLTITQWLSWCHTKRDHSANS